VAEAFLAASRAGDLAGLVALLDPDAVLRGDAAAQRLGGQAEIRGAEPIARFFSGRAGGARPMLAGGEPALVVAPAGRLLLVLRLSFHDGRIAAIDAVAEPARLAALELTLPGD
jgi:RNA polymerase sigma-70 factor, ECF subfamily